MARRHRHEVAAAGAQVLVKRGLTLLLFVLPLVACGGTSGVTSFDPLARAATKTTDVAGAHFVVNGHVLVEGKKASFSGPGEIADHGRTVHIRLSVPTAGDTLTVEAIGAGGAFYLRGGPFSQLAGGKWLRVKGNALGMDLSQNNPAKLLDYLRATSQVTKLGSATVRGEPTTHYRARIQLDKLSPDAAGALSQTTEANGLKEVPVDAWIGDDGLVRRLTLDLQRHKGAVAVSVDFFDFGAVSVKLPDASETKDLGQLGGGG
jgi:hypothetical protein